MATRKEDLDTYVRRQSADDLATVLLELAEANPQVRQRLVRMQLAVAAFGSLLAGLPLPG
jgi:hypothetical protein